MINQIHTWVYIWKKMKTLIWKDTFTPVFIAYNIYNSFHGSNPSTDNWIKKVYILWNVVVAYSSGVWLFCNSVDCSLPGSFIYGIFQAIILGWVSIFFSKGSSQPRYQTQISCIYMDSFTAEQPGKPTMEYYSAIKRN